MSITAILSATVPTLLGFAVNIIPSVVNYYVTKQRYEYELKIRQLSLEILQSGHEMDKVLEGARSIVNEGESLREHDLLVGDNQYVNILRASVRPVLTYFFFLLFVLVKIATLYLMAQAGADPFEILNAVWDPFTISIFGAVIGFWFGARSMVYINDAFNKPKKTS